MEVMARQGVTIAFPEREAEHAPSGDVVALRSPARDTTWPVSAEALVREVQQHDEPVTVAVLRIEISRGSRLRRRRQDAGPSTAGLVRRWRGELGPDERLVGLQGGLVGLLLPRTGLDDAFSRVEELRDQAGRAVRITATVAAVRSSESLADASLRAERKLLRPTRPGCSALAV